MYDLYSRERIDTKADVWVSSAVAAVSMAICKNYAHQVYVLTMYSTLCGNMNT